MSLKADLKKKQGGTCFYCGCKLTLEKGFANTGTLEHIQPQSRGNISTQYMDNLAVACTVCNRAKGNMTLEEFKKWIASINQKWCTK